MMSVYLAGPDVFLPDAARVGERKVQLCRSYDLEGLFPLDGEADPAGGGEAIYTANCALMERAEAVLANVSPFRGPSADVGTALEIGWFAARRKPIFAYSNDPRDFDLRTRAMLGLDPCDLRDGGECGVESFGLWDNLMLPGAVAASGGRYVAEASDDLAAMPAFERCLAAAAEALLHEAATISRGG